MTTRITKIVVMMFEVGSGVMISLVPIFVPQCGHIALAGVSHFMHPVKTFLTPWSVVTDAAIFPVPQFVQVRAVVFCVHLGHVK